MRRALLVNPPATGHVTLGLALWLAIAAITLTADQAVPSSPPQTPASASAQDRPTFRAGTDVAEIPVSVLDGHRAPVHGLTASDFTLRVDGKVRSIVALTEVTVPGPSTSEASWVRDRADDGTTPEASPHPRADGRIVVILLDRSIPPGPPTVSARQIATAAVNQLGPNDLAAVLYTGTGVPQNFTGDRLQLMRVVNASDPSTEPTPDTLSRADFVAARVGLDMSTLDTHPGGCQCGLCVPETIAHIAETLRDVPGRKTLLHIGYGLTWQTSDVDCGGRLHQAVEKMFAALDAGGVTVHSFNPVGLEAPGTHTSSQIMRSSQSLQVLPDRTGGRAITEDNAPESFMPQIFAESASYYVVGYTQGKDDPVDRGQKIQISVSRPDVHVLAQRQYVAPSTTAHAGPAGALTAAIPSFVPSHALTVRGVAAPFALPGSPGAVVIVTLGLRQAIEAQPAGGTAAEASRTDRLNVSLAAFDPFAAPKANDYHTVEVAYRALGQGSLAIEVLGRLPLKPGRYEIRAGATGSDPVDGGAVSTYLDVPDFAGDPFSLSGLVLASPASAHVVSSESVSELLPVVPTAQRTFAAQDHVTAFVRAYQGGHGTLGLVQGSASLRDVHDQIVWQQPIALEAASFGSTRSADKQIDLPIATLPVGEYLLTMQLKAGTRTVSRTTRITIQ